MRLTWLSVAFTLLGARIGLAEPPAGPSGPSGASLQLRPGVVVFAHAVPFQQDAHEIRRCQSQDWSPVCLIDHKPVFGSDGEMPRTVLDEVRIELPGAKVRLDVSGMFDPWNGQPSKEMFVVEDATGGMALRGCFSDGAGSYVAEWLVIDGTAVRTVLSNDEAIGFSFACNRPGARPSNSRLQRPARASDAEPSANSPATKEQNGGR